MRQLFAVFRRFDLYLLGISIFLVCVGFLMIYSTSFTDSGPQKLIRQVIFFGVGVLALWGASVLNYRYLKRAAIVLYAAAIALLAGVLVFGANIRGSARWFDLGIVQLQPVEFAKLALIIFLAFFFQRRTTDMGSFRTVITSLLITAIPVGLTLYQPDLGSAIVLGFIWFGMLLAAGPKKIHLFWLALIFCVVSVFGWTMVLQDYQKARVETFLNPAADPLGQGYNTIQSTIAVGSGGWFGRGLARGVVSQLRFLPERQTDFIFASLAEELGFVGTSFLLFLIIGWLARIVSVSRGSQDNFGFFVSLGIFYYFFSQSAINIAMNVGALPITGIPLPLISYGGSSLITSLAAIGILESIVIHSQPVRFD